MYEMKSIEQLIGNTPLIELQAGAPANVFAKLEKNNPGGSIKDRVAKAIIDDAEKKGKLKAGGTVIEATSGNTGIGLALMAAARGYKAVIVMPETMSVERQKLIGAFGAEVLLTEGSKGMQGAVEKAETLLNGTPNAILADQFNNPVCADVHYQTTGVEIYRQTQGKVDIFVACVGTGGTLTGVGRYLKEQNPQIKVVAVEPAKSPLLSQGKAGSHGIQGIGANFVPTVLDRGVYDEVLTVTDEEAFDMARALGKQQGLFVGISSGAAYAAALKLANRPENKEKNIVTVFPDDGGRYLSVL
ncbi:MAG: cysteine synthase A [Clostridia bacterium]|nr:cysteine synthase A [Clostridia bacterium]